MRNFYELFLLFISYAFLGWIVETIYTTIRSRRLINRGFLIGPIIPIYGFGGILMSLVLARYADSPILLFFMAIIIFSVLEYSTSFVMEKIFHVRWWDYADRKFHLNGRICLETMLPFGVLGMLGVYFIQPFLLSILSNMPNIIIIILFWSIAALLVADFCISLEVLVKYRKTIKKLAKDSTEDISLRARREFLEGNLFRRRLMRAFPGVQTRYERLIKLQNDINKQLAKLPK